jgi:hypothetical protein
VSLGYAKRNQEGGQRARGRLGSFVAPVGFPSPRIRTVVTSEDLHASHVSRKQQDKRLEVTFSGARALRRSQTMMTGDISSSDAVTSRVA